MTYLEAKREFEIRLYLWAKCEWEMEIAESFPKLRLFKNGLPWQTYQFLRQLRKSEQMALVCALLQRRWPSAADALGDSCSMEGASLRSRRDDFFRIRGLYRSVQRLEKEKDFVQARMLRQRIQPDAARVAGSDSENEDELWSRLDAVFEPIPPTFDEEIAARELAGEKVEFVNKRALMKVMKAKYLHVFDGQSPEPYAADGEPGFAFKTRCCGWILTTSFDFGRQEDWIEYSHDIESEDMFVQRSPRGKCQEFLRIGRNVSFCSWMGIDAVTQWRQITNNEVELSCGGAIKFCQQFFDIAPKLLKGLEFDKITGE
jgi:hypothetical protein